MQSLLLLLLALPMPALAQQCGILGYSPQSIGGCTINDRYGRPAVRLTEPLPGTGYQSQPVPGYRPANVAPTPQSQPSTYWNYR